MIAPLGEEPSRRGGVPGPTEHQLRMAEVRSRATGESFEHVLSVFMGVGRYGDVSTASGAEHGTRSGAPLTDASAVPPVPGAEEPEAAIAPVIPLSRAARGRRTDASGPPADES